MKISLLYVALLLSGCATPQPSLPDRIAKYYPTGSGGIMGLGREVYIQKLFVLKPESESPKSTYHNFYDAYRGDDEAFIRFLKSDDATGLGENGEGWLSDTVVLVLAHQDEALYHVLTQISPTTRNYVCHIMTVCGRRFESRMKWAV